MPSYAREIVIVFLKYYCNENYTLILLINYQIRVYRMI